ncbi:MAG TPA: glycosyltransferase [Deltaproteobacteria bacterium]|nr:glycosyltransferase [Deltaproteobacteria bacterium]
MTGFSIIIPVKEINDYLRESIPHLLALDYQDYEVLILPNEEPSPLESAFVDERVKIIPTGAVSPAVKRDMGAEQAKFEYLAFMDDDAYPSLEWLKVAEKTFTEKNPAALGGPGMVPPDASKKEIVSGIFYETLVGGGGLAYRYRPAPKGFYVKDYPSVNLIIRKNVFLEIGGFDNAFWPGEDTKLCLDLIQAGHDIWYEPTLLVYHHRRPTFRGHFKQVGGYGLHRGHFAKIYPHTSALPLYFAPSTFLLGNIILFFLGFANTFFWQIWSVLLAVYLLLAIIDIMTRTRDLWIAGMTLLVLVGSHLVYGWRFIQGYFTSRLVSKLR